MSRKAVLPAVIALALGACATIPQPLTGTYPPVPLDAARRSTAQGTRVRWGGRIIETEPRQQQTCFYVLSEPLDSQARPEIDEQSQGRFVACHEGFYDPEVFAKGRELTVTGTLQGSVPRKIGDYDYNYPKVTADVVYLWPKRPKYVARPYYDPFYDPFWGPFGYGFGYGPGFFYPPPVIIVHPRSTPPPKTGH
ncbi:MAG: Slp family lipoprotein [Rhodanobacteraceae bacterium]